MDNRSNVPALDLPGHLVDRVAGFGARVERVSLASLIALAVRLDRTRENAQRLQASAAQLGDLRPDFIDGLADIDTHVDCLWQLVEAEIERRITA